MFDLATLLLVAFRISGFTHKVYSMVMLAMKRE